MGYKYMPSEGVREGNELVKKIMQQRQENGKIMSMHRIAKVVGVDRLAVYKWVNGMCSPAHENYMKLVDYEQFLKLINRNRPFEKK